MTINKLPTPVRRTQAQRSEHTRRELLEATIASLVDVGYARTSVTEICRRAGVSRGAQQHHFSTKADLMAQAIEHLATELGARFAEGIEQLPHDVTRTGKMIDLLWQAYSGDLSSAALELWVASRTDPELRAAMLPVDRALGRETLRMYAETVDGKIDHERAQTLFWLTVNLTRGLAMDAELGGDENRRQRQLQTWKLIAAEYLGESITQ